MDVFEPWLPYIVSARANLVRAQYPDNISPDWIARHLDAMRCSPNYPDIVAHNVSLARELCVAGTLFYELFTTSVHYSASACETALKQRFVDLLPLPCRLTKRGDEGTIEEKTLEERVAVDQLVYFTSEGWKLPPPYARFKPTLGYLISWGVAARLVPPEQERWYRHRQRMRNTIAHGHDMVVPPSWALGTLQQTIVTLNRLFPDPETRAYDEAVTKQREERDREWTKDLEGMLRLPPDSSTEDTADDEDVAETP